MNKTFLRWAGGKKWLVKNHSSIFPNRYNRYIEPFLGGGSVYFYLEPEEAILSDLNNELITTFTALRDNWRELQSLLKAHSRKHSKDYYYHMRDGYRPRKPLTIAARFLYLNRTCFNGIYRVNSKNIFNVPIGTLRSVLQSTDRFDYRSEILQGTELHCRDFEETIDQAVKDDFLFCDPPYTVRHNNNGFISYNERLFTWEDQVRLFNALIRAKNRDVKIMMTNANHKSIYDMYLDAGFNISVVTRYSAIAGNPVNRDQYQEIIVTANNGI